MIECRMTRVARVFKLIRKHQINSLKKKITRTMFEDTPTILAALYNKIIIYSVLLRIHLYNYYQIISVLNELSLWNY